jgi:1,4-dihydroxy-6-naphthoate synthase
MNKSEFSIGFSPCPNDTFIFDAMVHEKIDTEGLVFDYTMTDVEELNRRAFWDILDITKLSYFAYAFVSDQYQVLNAGSAVGYKCGPLLVSKKNIDIAKINRLRIAVPGEYTTANFLFSLAFPKAKKKKMMVFSDIEDAILRKEVDAGVIIHENRFTYEQKGLQKVMDLGEYWEEQTRMPIPLGAIAVKRSVDFDTRQKIDRIIKRSIEFAYANPASGYNFIKDNAQEMDEAVRNKHIQLYVNNFTLDLGLEGINAVKLMYEKAAEKKIISAVPGNIFV